MRNKQCVLDSGSRDSPIEPVLVKSAFLPEPVAGDRFARQPRRRRGFWLVALIVMVIPLGILLREDLGRHGSAARAQLGWNQNPAKIEIATLVLREGLECVLVLAAITAGLKGGRGSLRAAIAVGAGAGFAATLVTWRVAARLLDDIGRHSSALALQAGTGLLAIIVLLVVMNWFLHRLYWTGWISLHQRKKQKLLRTEESGRRGWGVGLGMASLGFTSFYREGFEVVLFLQSYRLRLGNAVVVDGVMLGMLASGLAAVLTFVAHRRLPYRRMLIATGLLLALVLLVMVGEEAQEMQLAGWLPTTRIPWMAGLIPSWMDFWFSLVPTAESLVAQALAALLVFGSYFAAGFISRRRFWERLNKA